MKQTCDIGDRQPAAGNAVPPGNAGVIGRTPAPSARAASSAAARALVAAADGAGPCKFEGGAAQGACV